MIVEPDRTKSQRKWQRSNLLWRRCRRTTSLGRPGQESRRDELRGKFQELCALADRSARSRIVLRWQPVIGSAGIQAELATNALGCICWPHGQKHPWAARSFQLMDARKASEALPAASTHKPEEPSPRPSNGPDRRIVKTGIFDPAGYAPAVHRVLSARLHEFRPG